MWIMELLFSSSSFSSSCSLLIGSLASGGPDWLFFLFLIVSFDFFCLFLRLFVRSTFSFYFKTLGAFCILVPLGL